MNIFKLPDLGEGLPDAIIREWFVKVGDEVTVDQPLAAMETAKALVDLPSPLAGKVEKLFGNPGDTIETGQPLIGFEGEGQETAPEDSGTVVGAIESSDAVIADAASGVQTQKTTSTRAKATPAVRALAKRLGVDLSTMIPTGNRITADEVKAASTGATSTAPQKTAAPEGFDVLSPARRAMVLSMKKSQAEVVPVTLCDDADLQSWRTKQDTTLRLIRAIANACAQEPMLNATFHGASMSFKKNEAINIGMAVDTPNGLYVPVLKDVINRDDASIREQINQFKQQATDKSIVQDDLHGATIMFSNFGTLAGRYATPIIVPPMVAIIGVGRSREEAVVVDGNVEAHRVMPLSLTVDHRLVTGGEAARFLKTLIESLEE